MAHPQPAIAALPYALKTGLFPGRVRLDDLVWPLERPERLRAAGQTLRDLDPQDHLLCFASDMLHLRPWFGTPARVSVMVLEPEVIHGKHMRRLRRSHPRFHKVLTCNESLLGAISNGVLFPLGGNWAKDWQDRSHTKTAMCSLIASGKRDLEGHMLRHDMVDWVRTQALAVDVIGKGYQPFEKKSDGLSPYRYSLIIENVRERNYFTEKLVDAVLCDTVPIYWGCPNLTDFMDTSGMILCHSKADLQVAVHAMSEAQYTALHPDLVGARAVAASFADIYARAAQAVLDASA